MVVNEVRMGGCVKRFGEMTKAWGFPVYTDAMRARDSEVVLGVLNLSRPGFSLCARRFASYELPQFRGGNGE